MVSKSNQPREDGLSRFIAKSGGVTRAQALDRAALKIELLRVPAQESVAFDLGCLNDYTTMIDAEPPRAVLDEVQRIAMSIASLAGLFGSANVGEAARLLADTIEIQKDAGVFDLAQVRVQCEGVQLLASGAHNPEEQERLIVGMRRVRDHARALLTEANPT